MRRHFVVLACCVVAARALAQPSADEQVGAVARLLVRVLGDGAAAFDLSLTPADGERFSYLARDGHVYVSATTPISLCRGVSDYLRRTCNVLLDADPMPPRLPSPLPSCRIVEGSATLPERLWLSPEAFGGAMAWWDWPQWERAIDQMALRGVNRPVACTAYDALARRVWRAFGLSDEELAGWFASPALAHLQRQARLSGVGEPLSLTWLASQIELQRRILARERSLGMEPVLPGFEGVVPPAFQRVRPYAKRLSDGRLDPRDPLFAEVEQVWLDQWQRAFGTMRHWWIDPFGGHSPELPESGRLAALHTWGQAVWLPLLASNPMAVWVLDGRALTADPTFWSEEAIESLLSAAPDDRVLLLDTPGSRPELWRSRKTARLRPWLWCAAPDGWQPPGAGLVALAEAPLLAATDADRGAMHGFGWLGDGGLDDVPAADLLADQAWTDPGRNPNAPRLTGWLPSYLVQRYGACPKALALAWSALLQGSGTAHLPQPAFLRRPSLEPPPTRGDDGELLRQAARQAVAAAGTIGGNERFRHDLVLLCAAALGETSDEQLRRLVAAQTQGDQAERKRLSGSYLALLADLDRLLATRPELRLPTWLAAARMWGSDLDEANRFERGLRRRLSGVGLPEGMAPAALGSGLVSGFWAERWRRFFEGLDHPEQAPPDLPAWEAKWANQAGVVGNRPEEDSVAVARQVLARWCGAPLP